MLSEFAIGLFYLGLLFKGQLAPKCNFHPTHSKQPTSRVHIAIFFRTEYFIINDRIMIDQINIDGMKFKDSRGRRKKGTIGLQALSESFSIDNW